MDKIQISPENKDVLCVVGCTTTCVAWCAGFCYGTLCMLDGPIPIGEFIGSRLNSGSGNTPGVNTMFDGFN
jgi:hypothetical protein